MGSGEVMNNLLLACSVGDIALLKRCLLSRTSPSATNKEVGISKYIDMTRLEIFELQGLSCLHLAAKNGHVDCLGYLLSNCSMDVNKTAAPSGYTALHFSVSTKTSGRTSLQCMKLLLERGTDQNMLVANKVEVMRALLDHAGRVKMARQHSMWLLEMAT